MSGPDGFRRVSATAEERATYGKRAPAVYRLECLECGARIWGSGLGIGSHRRSRAHMRPGLLRQAEHMESLAAQASGTDADWYKADAARLRALAE